MTDPSAPSRSALLLACGDGLYDVQKLTAVPIKKTADLSFRPNVLTVSKLDPTRVWVGLFDGLTSFRWIGGRWIDEGTVAGAEFEIRSMLEEPDGSLWVGTAGDGALARHAGLEARRRCAAARYARRAVRHGARAAGGGNLRRRRQRHAAVHWGHPGPTGPAATTRTPNASCASRRSTRRSASTPSSVEDSSSATRRDASS